MRKQYFYIFTYYWLIFLIHIISSSQNHQKHNFIPPNQYMNMTNKPRNGLKTIFWMHIQKTSSWLGNFLLVWSCPDFLINDLQRRNITLERLDNDHSIHHVDYAVHLDEYFQYYNISRIQSNKRFSIMNCSVNFNTYGAGFGFHRSYHKPDRMNHTIVTLFRNPSSRIISAFLFDIMFPLGIRLNHGISTESAKDSIRKSNNSILSYATWPGMASCQTKMILGKDCGDNVIIHIPEDLNEAKRRLYDLYFFGLTEESEASANLFLAMHYKDGGLPYRKSLDELVYPPFKFTTTRKNMRHNHHTHQDLSTKLIESGWRDVYDEELYEAAGKIFYERCREYKIKTKFKSIEDLKAKLSL